MILGLRNEFPILNKKVYDKPLVYLDNAATTQKPRVVIDKITNYYGSENANVHRGSHFLSDGATSELERVRSDIQKFINARDSAELIFTSGATESINLVAYSYARKFLQKGDEVLISVMEHHSNILPWQHVCKEKQATLVVAPLTESGDLDMARFCELLSTKTRLVAMAYVSSTTGVVNPIKGIVEQAHRYNATVLVDAAQALGHLPMDVQELDCDFLVASAHKAYGPTGVGILYAKASRLDEMDPYQMGGGMVSKVSFENYAFASAPHKFEAGTPNISGILGFGEALKFMKDVGFDYIEKHEGLLTKILLEGLSKIGGINILNQNSADRIGIVSFYSKNLHALDLGVLLDANGIAVRTGSLCAQPLLDFLGVLSLVRISCAVYNTEEEILKALGVIAEISDKARKRPGSQ